MKSRIKELVPAQSGEEGAQERVRDSSLTHPHAPITTTAESGIMMVERSLGMIRLTEDM